MLIKLNTVDDVYKFVSICEKCHDENIDVKQGRHVIDGKSILGIFSLNLLEPVEVVIDSVNDSNMITFHNNIEKWRV